MAWRIDESVIRGEIDNRIKGRLTGKIWFVGIDEPVELKLEGNPWRDLAGHVLTFTNPNPKPGNLDSLAKIQQGVVGDITASRKVKIPELPIEEVMKLSKAGLSWPWHWANSLYLEWFSARNGRVVIESADYQIQIDAESTWSMDEAMELEQCKENAMALTNFMDRLCQAIDDKKLTVEFQEENLDEDEPQSRAEAQADAEAAYMNQLLDRVEARMEREGWNDMSNYDTIYEEERERLRRDLGMQPDPEPTPEQLEQNERWIAEMNAIAKEALSDMEAEKWKGHQERKRPELVERTSELGISVHKTVHDLLPANPPQEHPLLEIVNGIRLASAKLAGALGCEEDEEDWPPDPLFAGGTLVRLKKARNALSDTLSGLTSADQENLGTPEWRNQTRQEIDTILNEVRKLIQEVRDVLSDGEV